MAKIYGTRAHLRMAELRKVTAVTYQPLLLNLKYLDAVPKLHVTAAFTGLKELAGINQLVLRVARTEPINAPLIVVAEECVKRGGPHIQEVHVQVNI